MKIINELATSLNQQFNWNKSRMNCFVRMLIGLISVRSVNLQEIATAFDSRSQISSRYRRIQRFFAFFEIDLAHLSLWLYQLFFQPADKVYVVIDRTNWYVGKKKINIFMLSVAYEGLAIPICWHLLNKAGSSSFEEQKCLLNEFIGRFGIGRIEGILGDREFMNHRLLSWLNKQNVAYYLRIKEGTQLYIRGRKWWSAKKCFRHLKMKEQCIFNMAVEIGKNKVFLAGSRSCRGELMIVVTNRHPKNAIAIYLRRWEVENLFQNLKGRGFRFEETHLTKQERISKLMALLAVGFAWAHKVGEWTALKKPILFKKFRTEQRPQNSFFRLGLDVLRDCFFHANFKKTELKQAIKLILPMSFCHGEAIL